MILLVENCEEVMKKLIRANGILSKLRHFVTEEQLKNVYYATFSSNMNYGSQIWGQSSKLVQDKITILQKKALRIMTFSDFKAHSEPLLK